MTYSYAHMCPDGHVQIGHSDSENERCPLCRANDEIRRLQEEIEEMKPTVMDWIRIHKENQHLCDVIEFYANPQTYCAIGFFPDRPCGDFMDDFSEDHGDETMPGPRPGKHARQALNELTAPIEPPTKTPL